MKKRKVDNEFLCSIVETKNITKMFKHCTDENGMSYLRYDYFYKVVKKDKVTHLLQLTGENKNTIYTKNDIVQTKAKVHSKDASGLCYTTGYLLQCGDYTSELNISLQDEFTFLPEGVCNIQTLDKSCEEDNSIRYEKRLEYFKIKQQTQSELKEAAELEKNQ